MEKQKLEVNYSNAKLITKRAKIIDFLLKFRIKVTSGGKIKWCLY